MERRKKVKLKDLLDKYGEYTVPNELIEKLEPPNPKTVWSLKNGDKYFYICDSGYIGTSDWYECDPDRHQREFGNVYLTKEEAEKDAERRKVEALLLKHGGRRWLNRKSENYYLWLREKGTGLVIADTFDRRQGGIYFDSREELTKAVEEIGAERIIKALFEVR